MTAERTHRGAGCHRWVDCDGAAHGVTERCGVHGEGACPPCACPREPIDIGFAHEPDRATPRGEYELVLAEDFACERGIAPPRSRIALPAGLAVRGAYENPHFPGKWHFAIWAEHRWEGPGDDRRGEYRWRMCTSDREPPTRLKPTEGGKGWFDR